MKQAIAGVSPAVLGEVTVMTVWPSIAMMPTGRWLGRLYSLGRESGKVLSLGRLITLLTVPLALRLYIWRIRPGAFYRYRLTNRRIVVQKGYRGSDDRAIDLDDFDEIDVEVLPGQAWFKAGELIFKRGNVETFRLSGVSRPETFRRTCLKARQGYVGVREAVGQT